MKVMKFPKSITKIDKLTQYQFYSELTAIQREDINKYATPYEIIKLDYI